jgi:hypothetical protein
MRMLLASTLTVAFVLLPAGLGLARGHPGASPTAISWTVETVEEGGQLGNYVSVAIDPESGTTYISYFDTEYDDLRVARYVGSGGNCGPGNGWTCEVVDPSVQGGRYSSIAIDPATGLPAVAYHGATTGSLKYAAYSCNSSCGWAVDTIEPKMSSYAMGAYASLDFLDRPYIAYTADAGTVSDLKLATYVGAGGNCGPGGDTWQCTLLYTPADVVQHTSLSAAGDGEPLRIAYHGAGVGLGLATEVGEGNGNCGYNLDWLCEWIDMVPSSGLYASLATSPLAEPRIAHYSGETGLLKLATYVGLGGNCGPDDEWQCDTIDDMGTSIEPMGLSMVLDRAGMPVIAYQKVTGEFTPRQLKVARPIQAEGWVAGNCGPSLDWRCETVDAGDQYLNEANYVDVAVDPVGLPAVAYRERDSYHYTSNLKLAYLPPYTLFLPVVLR